MKVEKHGDLVKTCISKICSIVITILPLLQGCESPFGEFYCDLTGGVDVTTLPGAIISKEVPKLHRSNDPEKDALRMLEDGYIMVGYSSFNAASVDENGALEQVKKSSSSYCPCLLTTH